ncbi:hypothetical protein GW922_02440 [Candidatus Pacearchaeota archaeon]|nr:MAG: hypothetical protein QJ16_C0005G0184 [archaeon GW2011_AR1]NCO18218.1 hypothetical protein [Candidatus Pacearchaeota archaeon]
MYTLCIHMQDIFDHTILCKKCGKPMGKAMVLRNGFNLRARICPLGHDKIIHPADEEEYKKFKELRQKEFKVKMRLVGNSYAVSIPKEIVSFMQDQEKIMNDMVRLCFEESGRLSLTFEELIDKNLNKSADKENID